MCKSIKRGVSVSQHFLLSAAARTLSLSAVARLSDEEARDTFQRIRWADNNGEPYCPRCGCLRVRALATRPVWKCGGCKHQFSVTSGTIFDNRKRPIRDYLLAIAIFVNGAKGHSALQLSRDLGCQYKTAFVLAHKIREAVAAETKGLKLSGEVEIDGCYVGGHVRPANKAEDRVDRRLAQHQTGKRRVVVALRQRKGRTLTFVVRNEADGVYYAKNHIETGTVIHADEAPHWDVLQWRRFELARINHSEAYSADGICTNQAESYFARLRRMIGGQHHHVSPQYLHQYASEAAWKEDHRRLDNGALASRAIRLAMAHRVSKNWCGYWQRAA